MSKINITHLLGKEVTVSDLCPNDQDTFTATLNNHEKESDMFTVAEEGKKVLHFSKDVIFLVEDNKIILG